jgi:hypothetical protein
MTLPWPPLNLWAVLAAGVATFLLGGIWYQALFGKAWVKAHGYTPEQIQVMQKARPPLVFFGTMILAYLLLATLMGYLVQWTGAQSWIDGVVLGLVVWGILVAVALTDYISSTKKPAVYFIDCTYQLCFLVMNGVILSIWRYTP